MPTNPYANARNTPETTLPHDSYRDASYTDPPSGAPYYPVGNGFAPTLRISPTDTPDANRLFPDTRHDRYPDPTRPPDEFWQQIDADKDKRYAVEQQDADGWEETKGGFGYPGPSAGANRFARNPRETPPEEPRTTSRLAPRSYNFLRPFMTGQPKMGKRDLNGWHFSMADHRRTGEILGMAPQRMPGIGTRNTYRITPGPWDENIVDKPANQETPHLQVSVPAYEIPSNSRSWRLQ